MRRTWVYDVDLDTMVEITPGVSNHVPENPASGVQIIRDIEPYRPVGADVDGKSVIGGRRQHREFLARNHYIEVGNETPKPTTPSWVEQRRDRDDRARDIKFALSKITGHL